MTLTRLVACAAALGSLVLGGCSGGDEELPPEEVLAAAKANLDETSGVRISLETEQLPQAVDGILSAKGVGTHDPAFDGELTVSISGVSAPVPVVATEGKVYAKLPFTTEFAEVDPADYGAPDPAKLMEPEGGLSSLLTGLEGVEQGEPVRSGEQVLTTYTGTVPGELAAAIVPTATPESDFEAQLAVDDEQLLREAVLTGPFYPGAAEVTYTVTFDDYGTTKDITPP